MAKEQSAGATRTMVVESLYQTHVRTLYTFIYAKVGNREAAEDITSEVFTKAVAYLDESREEYSIVSWLYRIARNAVIDYWRAREASRVLLFDEARMKRQADPLPVAAHGEQAAARASAILNRLPDNYRTVLSCRLLEGFSVADTARQMGISEANVKVLQHRALKRAAGLREEANDGR